MLGRVLDSLQSDLGERTLAQTDDLDVGQRRRRKRRQRLQARKAGGKDDASRASLGLFGIMCAALLTYCGLTMWHVQAATRSIGPYALGMTKADVRYRFGNPQEAGAGAKVWNYVNVGSRIRLGFGADGGLALVTCLQEELYEGPGPQKLGVGIGSTEGDVVRLLGPPDAARYDREDKIVQYRGIGLKARFRKLRVVEIEHSPASSAAGMARVALWRMLP